MWSLPPEGAHIWRQADAAAMAQNYQEYDLPFSQPETFNLQSENGKVAGEFPVFYFIAAKFTNVSFALRILHSFVFFLGIIALYFIAMYFLKDEMLSIFVAVLFTTSPLLVFYGNNFLSDVPALSFVFIGWAFFLHHFQKRKILWMSIAVLCFVIAALLKASQAIFGLLLSFLFYSIYLWKNHPKKIALLLLYVLGLLPVVWYAYAKYYNQIHHDNYYFLSIAPVWKLSPYEIGLGIWRMLVSGNRNYFWLPSLIIMLSSIYFLVMKWKKVSAELQMILILSFLLTIAYIVFFYHKMLAHEYYYIPFFVMGLFGIISIVKVYHTYHAENIFGHTALFLLLIPNIIFCKHFVTEKLRYSTYNAILSSKEMETALEKNGISQDKIILSLPDETPNQSLNQLRRKGYTSFNDYKNILKNKRADYLVLSDVSMKNDERLMPFLKDSIADIHGVVLYKLEREN